MSYFPVLLTVMSIHFLVTISPGPNFLMSARFGLAARRKHGFYVTSGIATGALIHIVICLFGMAGKLTSLIPIDYIKIVGSCYFIYLGIRLFFSKSVMHGDNGMNAYIFHVVSSLKVYRIGFFTMLLNPKSTIHFLILFSSMMDMTTPLIIKILICFLLPLITFSWHSTVMLSFSVKGIKIFYQRFFRVIDPIFGFLLIFLAYGMILEINYHFVMGNYQLFLGWLIG